MRALGLLTLPVLTMALSCFAAYHIYEHYAADLPGIESLAHYQPSTTTRVYADDGRLLAEYAVEKRVFVPVDAMPPRLIDAFLAAEDRDFYRHGGIDVPAILRAGVIDLLNWNSGRRLVGASTITQQVAKNFLLGDAYTFSRKLREMILAERIERALSKPQILELYLNQIYLGRGAYGVGEAALTYFNKSLDDLDLAECAYLASLPKAPENYDPTAHYAAAKARRDWVLEGMRDTGAITGAEMQAAQSEPITLRQRSDSEVFSAPYFTEMVRRELVARFGEAAVYKGGLSVRTSLRPDLQQLADQALRDGLIAYDRRHGYRGPLGHIDPRQGWQQRLAAFPVPPGSRTWQIAVIRAVHRDGLTLGLVNGSSGWMPMSEIAWARADLPDQRVGARPTRPGQIFRPGDIVLVERLPNHLSASPGSAVETAAIARYGLRQIPEVNGAIVVLDPHTGRIFAISGGFSHAMGPFDRATEAYRQTGSAIKPIVYLAALDNGMTPSSLILDAPLAISQGPGMPLWRPEDYESHEYLGPVTLRVAIEKSLNTAAVRMAATIGLGRIIPYIENLGIIAHVPPEYSYVLGAGTTTPLRLTAAYAMLVNGGKRIVPSLIDRVQDRDGKTIFKHDTRICARCGDYNWAPPGEVPNLPDDRPQILDPATAYQMVNILRGVVQRGTAAREVGPLGLPLAGKTGTTNDEKDAWFVGFSPDLVAGVYVGFDQPRTLGAREQGASVAAPIFAAFMKAALEGQPPIPFRIPPGVDLVRVDPTTGRFASANDNHFILEAFKPGTEPLPADLQDDERFVQDGTDLPVAATQTPSPPFAGTNLLAGTGGLY